MRKFVEFCLLHVLLVLVSACLTVTLFTVTPLDLSAAEPPGAKTALPSAKPTYERDIAPLFKAKCSRCHGEKRQKAELTLHTPEGILKGGESGEVIVPGKPDESLLYEMLADGLMPPKKKDRLSTGELETVHAWIAAGADLGVDAVRENTVTEHDVIPILLLRCTVCHGQSRREADLDLRTRESILKGGKSGPAIVPGKPDESLLVKRVRAEEMPPKRELVAVSIKVMADHELDLIARWIAAGAVESAAGPDIATTEPDLLVTEEDRQFWAFQRPRAAATPTVHAGDRVRNSIDAFVLRKLEERDLTLSTEADRRTLVRRLHYDLTGLPPTPEAVDAFLADTDPMAYERLVDGLLASPRYGERWGRVWLDLAGYSDSEGIQHADALRPGAYRYRDYVIQSFNSDKPYDIFLQEQIAGDELVDYESAEVVTEEMYQSLVATGFLRMARDGTYANITNFVPDRVAQISDEIEVLGTAVMGLTIKCARCHSHKFDPIPQRDYYRLAAVFKGAYDEHNWLVPAKRTLPHVTTKEREAWAAAEKQLAASIADERSQLEKKRASCEEVYLEKRLADLPDVLREDLRAMLQTADKDRSEVEKYLATKFEKKLRIDVDELKKIDAEFKTEAESIEAEIKRLEAQKRPEPVVRALWDRGEPSPTYILMRGSYLTPGRLVGPGVPSVLTDGKTPLDVRPPSPSAKKTGRRLAFARWLTKPEHPLTARVMVNRIWKHHFGHGIVKTLDNFGKAGAPPTHPELLDWLAVEFVRNGWHMKHIHRLILNSSVYRQSSEVLSAHERLDPDNRWLSRMPLRRLEAEELRDALLAVSGRLDLTPFGPADAVDQRKDGLVTSVANEKGWRRSVYVLQRRSQALTILENFDLPQMNPNCVERPESIVAPQALHLLNNTMVHELSIAFGKRVQQEVGDDREQQIRRIYRLALSRAPSVEETATANELIAKLKEKWLRAEVATTQENASGPASRPDTSGASTRALANFCHAIMNSAEFLYLD